MRIYIQDLGKYNNGCNLCGEWIDLEKINEDELNKKMKKLINEEFIILDWEYEDGEEIFFKDIMHEYADPFELLIRQQELENLSKEDKDIVKALILNGEDFDTALKIKDEVEVINLKNELSPFGKSEVALADYLIENGLIEVNEFIKPYIDYEKLGRDLSLDYSEPIEGLFLRY